MILETTTNLDPDWGELVDIDVLESGDWAGLFRVQGRLFVRTPHWCTVAPCEMRFPLIRCLDSQRFTVADTRTQSGRTNAWVLHEAASAPCGFFAGDGIEDVLAADDSIVVTYFDEGIYRGIAPGEEGIAVFTSSGGYRFGYRSMLGAESVAIDDCYAACWDTESRIVFFPYGEFPLVRWKIGTRDQVAYPTPKRVHGASAITVTKDTVLFFGPYEEKNVILEWTPGRGQELAVVGTHPGPLRGLRGGRFLTHDASRFTIIEKAAQQGVAPDETLAPPRLYG